MLVLDTTGTATTVTFRTPRGCPARVVPTEGAHLLRAIATTFRATRCTLADITVIDAAPGPGLFSRVRLGVTTANALAWALGITLRARGRTVHHVVPIYGQPPHITMPSKK